MATPILEAALADERLREVRIALRAHLVDVLSDGPLAEHLVPIERRADEVGVLRAEEADALLLMSNSLGAAWRGARTRIPVRAGAALGARRWLLTHRVVPPTRDGRRIPIPTAHLLRDVAGLLGIAVPGLRPRLHLTDELVDETRRQLEGLGLERGAGYVLCAPAAAFGSAKLWPPERHAAVLDALHERTGLRGVVTGAPGEEPQIDAVVRAARHPALGLTGEPRGLRRLKALVAGARLLLVGDSGPRWYAAAFEVPCVSVMGPNFPELTASSLEWCTVVRREGLECAPCLERRCPLGHHRCMRELGTEPVIVAAERLLERRAAC